ncbi:MAG: type VI secretion system tube protein TssD [Thermodesulfobacteriota bacterium]|nr:type VI secretion system tube protein TssD [Thermodesulfobacteriota bacterium]
MAQNIHVWVRGPNVGEVRGDSTVTSMGREGSIEAFKLEHMVKTHRAASGGATGERSYDPITITKRIDQSSPILHQALCNNEELEVTIKFYRPSPAGDGTTEQFYTVGLRQGRISSIKTISPSTFDESTENVPAMEEVSFVFGRITWTYESGGIEFEDEWRSFPSDSQR